MPKIILVFHWQKSYMEMHHFNEIKLDVSELQRILMFK
ncbi:hypothetical protein MARTH_orf381 [Metamycoplasma arthritidis 158L3-1]|uniref:Uncharacterized protein n=1 Tax=Metamycoplasma arthritidis (strain 158L3-1) TaxID=243272 RepID=B3PMJ7_META1|nr:hypothetical protein MARTH_orf381 [Metamycoplasma arthritidis 158L3-1]